MSKVYARACSRLAFQLVSKIIHVVMHIISLIIILLLSLFISLLQGRVEEPVVFLILVDGRLSLEELNGDHPAITSLRRATAEVYVSLAAFLAFCVRVHGDADHEGWSLVPCLLRLHDSIDEWEVDHPQELVCFELLLVVEPFELVLCQSDQTLLGVFVDCLTLLEDLFFKDELPWVSLDLVLDFHHH